METIETLKHRLAMVQDDLKVIVEFIDEQGLHETFAKPTPYSDECWHHINNIKIACDLSSEESLSWKPFSKKN